MKSIIQKSIILFIISLTLLTSTNAIASGVLKGRLTFYNKQGNYCPSHRDCTGAQYLESEFEAYLGIRNVKMEVRDFDTGVVLGQSVTDSNGYFEVYWDSASPAPRGYIATYLEQSEGRFQVMDPDSTTHRLHTSNVWEYLFHGTSEASPQQLGTYNWGSPTTPNIWANVYDGAWRTWYKAFRYSGLMVSRLNNVKIYTGSPNSQGITCNTSCAWDQNIIIDSTFSALAPQSRIMHEMGHVASTLSSENQNIEKYNDYCWPDTYTFNNGTCSCSDTNNDNFNEDCEWFADSPEWGAPQFEEGMASFFGTVAIYWYNSKPYNCLVSEDYCPNTNNNNIEYKQPLCISNTNRHQINVERYLWDLYDTSSEAAWDDEQEGYHWFFTALNSYESDFPDNIFQKGEREPYDHFGNIDERDGRSARDFYFVWEDLHNNNQEDIYLNNCLNGVGD